MQVIEQPCMIEQLQITQHLEYQEAQLRIQLRTGELMMTSLKESSQENSERQALISERQLAISLQSEMGQASSAWKTEVLRFTKEVAEQNTKRRVGENRLLATLNATIISAVAARRRQTVGANSVDFSCFVANVISYR